MLIKYSDDRFFLLRDILAAINLLVIYIVKIIDKMETKMKFNLLYLKLVRSLIINKALKY